MMSNWIKLTGKLIFDPVSLTQKQIDQSSWKKTAIIQFDCDIAEYYNWFVNRRYNIKLLRPQRGAHMTVISDKEADNTKWESVKERLDGTSIDVYYNPDVRGNEEYWWLKSISPKADVIRSLLCLGDPFYSYHITIGSIKNSSQINQEHNRYVLRMIEFFNEKNVIKEIPYNGEFDNMIDDIEYQREVLFNALGIPNKYFK